MGPLHRKRIRLLGRTAHGPSFMTGGYEPLKERELRRNIGAGEVKRVLAGLKQTRSVL